jgi:hypothetical protein
MLKKILVRFFIIIIILSVFIYKNNPIASDANAEDQILDYVELKDSLDYVEIELTPYEKRLGEIYLTNPVFKREINITF